MYNIKQFFLYITRLFIDFIVLTLIFSFVNFYDVTAWYTGPFFISIILLVLLSWYVFSFYTLLYDEYRSRNFLYEILGVVKY